MLQCLFIHSAVEEAREAGGWAGGVGLSGMAGGPQ